MRILKKICVMALFLPTLSLAQPAVFSQTQPLAQVPVQNQNPWPLLQAAIKKLNEINYYGRSYQAKQLINRDIMPLFDFEHISQKLLENIPLRLNQNQQQAIQAKIQSELSNLLFSQLTSQRIYGFQVINVRPISLNNLKISLRVNTNSYIPMMLDLFISSQSGDWKIVDVALNNSSLVNYFQQVIIRSIYRHGPNAYFL